MSLGTIVVHHLLEGRVALVTGGGSGIGAVTAILFSQHGCKVMISDISEQSGRNVISKMGASQNFAFVKSDVSKQGDCEMLIQETVKKFGKLDIAFNNAGIGGEQNSIADMSTEGWLKVIDVNLNSVFYCMKYEIAAMMKNGKGSIVNMSSILGQVGFAYSAAYVAAKHGVVGLTQTVLEFSSKNIRINTIGPAFINTPLLSALSDEMKQQLVKAHPIGRLGTTEEVAEMVLWLSSDKSSFATGAYYALDGGYLAQ